MQTKTFNIYLIYARTGCTCCSDNNHYRGPYKTSKDAKKRKAYYLNPNSEFWPVASQYARQGIYNIIEANVEQLPDGRCILDKTTVIQCLQFINVGEDGAISDNDSELFYDYD